MTDVRAAVFNAPGEPLVVQQLELAEPGAGEVSVRLAASGVCHSDYHVVLGEWSARTPLVLGHEGAGVVDAVGPGVTTVGVGDHVVLSWVPYCGHCRYCADGRPALCRRVLDTTYHGLMADGTTRLCRDGRRVFSYLATASFAERVVVAESAAVPVRKDAPLATVALVGCAVATGVGAVLNTARVRPGSSVLVIGCGGVGLSVLMGAKLVSAGPVIAVDRSDPALELAARLGATVTVNPDRDDLDEVLREHAGPDGVDYAFEAIGLAPTIETCYRLIRPGGTAVAVGMVPEGVTITIDPFSLADREKTLTGSNYGSSRPAVDFPKLVDLYMTGRLDLDAMVTRTIGLDQVNDAFDAMSRGEAGRSVIRF
jgi:S-(hydroxymethyl)glutathione dehydrogenase / alcohol dehydrogenase